MYEIASSVRGKDPAQAAARARIVAGWLLACCAAVLAMVVVGGVTRLTESGLSITEWRPLTGAIPPLSEEEWWAVFELYRQIPEYQLVNRGMSLDEFKFIFWWEYAHRQLGRVLGLVYAIPFIIFLARGWLTRPFAWKLGGILVLGGLQGVIGWWMVASGLTERTSVSQYRLAVHLGVALLILALMLWQALVLMRPTGGRSGHAVPMLVVRSAWVALVAVCLTIASGAFVAGTHAGMIYNDFPMMGTGLVPPEYGAIQPFWLNIFENRAAIQFNHRWLAIATATLIFWLWIIGRGRVPAGFPRLSLDLFAATAALQIVLGVATLLSIVALPLAAAHQAVGTLLLAAATMTVFALGRRQAG